MKTRLLAMIILFNMLSPLSYAGTEETKKCLERIDYLKNEIDRIHGAIETDNKTKETIDKKRSDLREKMESFSTLPLVPAFIMNKKTGPMKEEISNLEKQLKTTEESLNKNRRELETTSENLNAEQNRLEPFKDVVIKHIEITASGDWDELLRPEILVIIGNSRFRGKEDSNYFECDDINVSTGDANGDKYIFVKDVDMTTLEEMGTIDLEKNSIGPGVHGDSYLWEIEGSAKSQDGTIWYTIKYEVKY